MKPEAIATAGKPTLAAVASLAGVSPSTASLAFSGAGPVAESTRLRVLAAAKTLRYAGPDPRAQSLRRGRSGIIGVVIEDRLSDAFRDPVNVAMLDGIAEETGAAGAGLLLLTEIDGDRANVSSAPMDAVILFGCSTRLDEAVAILRLRGVPIVAIEAEDIDGVLPIGLDNRFASAFATRHLVELGHQRIAVVSLPINAPHVARPLPDDWESSTVSYTALERLRGVQEVIGPLRGFVSAGSTIDAGREAGLALLGGSDLPTAIIAQSDLLAVGVLRAAEELGIAVPGQLSVIGFDGIDATLDYDLTTLVQPAVAKGRAAGRAVLQLLDGSDP
ncbi:MAG: transcriptional regulator, partial [Glaciihabitans sp.]|nr:transcriptional regulator [Glaciihabitans sp.]